MSIATKAQQPTLYGVTSNGGSGGGGNIFGVRTDGTNFQEKFAFVDKGRNPTSDLLKGTDGKLYGMTHFGGSSDAGIIFSTNTDGKGYTFLHNFNSTNGGSPNGSLIQGTDGKLYGMTSGGGGSDKGVVFSMNTEGTGYSILLNFNGTNGSNPEGSLLQGKDGKLYGMTSKGGSSANGGSLGYGVIFRINTDGTGYAIMQNFNNDNGAYPQGSLIQGRDGKLYGMTLTGGNTGYGVIFSINTDDTGFTVLQNFNSTNGASPFSSLLQGADGKLYGMTSGGGGSDKGVIFSMNIDGTGYNILQNFNGTNGYFPYGSLLQGNDGKLYGMTQQGGSSKYGIIFNTNTDGTGYNILQNFDGTNGYFPQGSLIQGTDGKLYGMTYKGGRSIEGSYGYSNGFIFSINADGTGYTIMQNFNNDNGAYPQSSLIKGREGKFYGMTSAGGNLGHGVIFSTNTDGTGYTILQNFNGTNGTGPSGSLLQGIDGKLYGMMAYGGSYFTLSNQGYGVIFSINTDGTGFTILQNFNGINGANPVGSLIQDTDGKLYGMTYQGGRGYGVIFRMNTDGTDYTILQNFIRVNGRHPCSSLIQGKDGKLYGLTSDGGSSYNGVIFGMNTDGTGYTILQNFNSTNGASPFGSLIQGKDGKFYGMTRYGGSSGKGVIFSTNSDSTNYIILQNFNGTNGASPVGSLTQGTDGKLYGVTRKGGSSNLGVVFNINPDGTGYSVLQNFNGTNGANPNGDLLLVNTTSTACPTLTLSPANPPAGTVGIQYNTTLIASGGTAPYRITALTGNFPPGLEYQSSGPTTGTILGVPTKAGSYDFVAVVTDTTGCTGTQNFTILINPATGGNLLPAATVNQDYTYTLPNPSGNILTLSSGSLPTGLYLDGRYGVVFGKPLVSGSFVFSVTGIVSGQPVTLSFTLNVNCPALSFLTEALPNAVLQTNYSQFLSASGGSGSYLYSLSAGALPDGLYLDGRYGNIFGKPVKNGVFTFALTATDDFGCRTGKVFTITVGCPGLSINGTPPGSNIGASYFYELSTTGSTGTALYSLATGALPKGVYLDGRYGDIFGRTTQTGAYAFTVTATDESGCQTSKDFTINVSCPQLTIPTTTLPDATLQTNYFQVLSATGGTGSYLYNFTGGALPDGVYLDGRYGHIFGKPIKAGTFVFGVSATDENGCTTTSLITINVPAAPGRQAAVSVKGAAGEAEQTVNLYPNPAAEVIMLSLIRQERVQVQLFDVMGRQVYNQAHEPGSDLKTTCNISKLASGTYFVKIIASSQTHVLKLIKN